MTQYDDFGRPIYETAEEYNKAHKGGVCPRTYDSPDGSNYQHNTSKETRRNQSAAQRYATRSGSKKAKTLIIGMAVFFIVVNMFVILAMFNLVRGAHESIFDFEENWVNIDQEGYEEIIGDDSTPLPEGFETFSYNGQYCTLYTSYEELLQLGFESEDGYEMTDEIPYYYEEYLYLDMTEGDNYSDAYVGVVNYMEEDIPLGKCIVYSFGISNGAVFDEDAKVPDFTFCNGLTFDSSYEDIEAFLGIPYYHYEDHSDEEWLYDNYEWAYYGEDGCQIVMVSFYNDVIYNVSIENSTLQIEKKVLK